MMKKYLKNPHVWSMLPIVCALSYSLAPAELYILYMCTFPIVWVVAGYQAYTTDADVKKTSKTDVDLKADVTSSETEVDKIEI